MGREAILAAIARSQQQARTESARPLTVSTVVVQVPTERFTQFVVAIERAPSAAVVNSLWQGAQALATIVAEKARGGSQRMSTESSQKLAFEIRRVRAAKDAALQRLAAVPAPAPGGGALDTKARDQALVDLAAKSGQVQVQPSSAGVSSNVVAALMLGGVGLIALVAFVGRPKS
jgi:hypothetical protein